jgi:nitrate reductase NapE component
MGTGNMRQLAYLFFSFSFFFPLFSSSQALPSWLLLSSSLFLSALSRPVYPPAPGLSYGKKKKKRRREDKKKMKKRREDMILFYFLFLAGFGILKYSFAAGFGCLKFFGSDFSGWFSLIFQAESTWGRTLYTVIGNFSDFLVDFSVICLSF